YVYIIRKREEDQPATTQPAAGAATTQPAAGPRPTGAAPATRAPPADVLAPDSGAPASTGPGAGANVGDTRLQEGFQFNELRPGTDKRTIRVPVQPLLNGDLRYNVVIRPGDLIVVPLPTVGEYYMGG